MWSGRIPKKGTGETPYRLTYGSEAVIPVEIGMPSLRVQQYNPETNQLEQRLCLDLLEERREQASAYAENYRRQMTKYFNKHIKPRAFSSG